MRDSASRIETSTMPSFEATMVRQIRKPMISASNRNREQRGARRLRLHVEAEDVLEVGQPVVAAEAEIVAEEAEHQRKGQRLRDDREIDAGDARAEREPAEHEGEHARHQHTISAA